MELADGLYMGVDYIILSTSVDIWKFLIKTNVTFGTIELDNLWSVTIQILKGWSLWMAFMYMFNQFWENRSQPQKLWLFSSTLTEICTKSKWFFISLPSPTWWLISVGITKVTSCMLDDISEWLQFYVSVSKKH